MIGITGVRSFLLFLTVGVATAGGVHAQGFPDRPIRILYPFGPGGAADVAMRALNPEASRLLGQSIVFENRPGGNARLGLQAMRAAKPDGHVLAVIPDGVVVTQPLADPDFKLEVGKDYAPVTFLFESPLTIAAHPSVPFRDIKGLIAYAKANPGKLNFGVGQGTATHFITEYFKQGADINIALIPYKGANQAQVDVLSGQVHLLMSSTVIKPFIDSGKLVGIATTGKNRWAAFPNLPTLSEAGIPVAATVWYGLAAPAETPKEAITALHKAFNQALRLPALQAKLAEMGLVTHAGMSPDDLADRIRSESRAWAPVIRKAGLKLQ